MEEQEHLRVCRGCLRAFRKRKIRGRKPRKEDFGGRWPSHLYHPAGEGRLCLRHRASANANNANLRAPGAYPAWADKDRIKAIYRECAKRRAAGEDVEVDHIVPLNGASVSGLHVHDNLRIITAKENHQKCNRWPLD